MYVLGGRSLEFLDGKFVKCTGKETNNFLSSPCPKYYLEELN